MPNHVVNRVVIIGTALMVADVLNTIRGDASEDGKVIVMDFNKVLPMPAELHEVRSPTNIVSQKEYNKEIKEIEERRKTDPNSFFGFSHNLTKKMAKEYEKKYGALNWYDWACDNWGTKWNAYSHEMISEFTPIDDTIGQAVIQYETAWSCAYRVIEKLSTMFPEVQFDLKWADEDAGYNTGKITYKNGEEFDLYQPKGGSQEAMDFYFDLHEYSKEDFIKNDEGIWVYKEE